MAAFVEFVTRVLGDRWVSTCGRCGSKLYTLKSEGEQTRRWRLAEHSADHLR